MKFEIVAPGAGAANLWLRRQCLVQGRVMMCLKGTVTRWHDNIIPASAGRGVTQNVYAVRVDDDCQGHLTEWERGGVTILEDDVQYICPRSAEVVACPI